MRTQIAILITVLAGITPASARAAEKDQSLSHGKQAFDYWCAICHSAVAHDGRPLPGTASLQVKYKDGTPAVLEQRDLPAAYVTYVIRHGSAGMPFFRKTEISDKEMQNIAAYLARNLK